MWRTALGMPVVPELNTNTASSSGSGSRRFGDGARRAIGSSRCSIGIRLGQHRVVADGVAGRCQRQRMRDLAALPGRADQHDRRTQPPDGPQRHTNSGRFDDISATRWPGGHPALGQRRGQTVR